MGLCFLASCTGSLLIGKFSLGLVPRRCRAYAPLPSFSVASNPVLASGASAPLEVAAQQMDAVASVSTSSSSRCSLGGIEMHALSITSLPRSWPQPCSSALLDFVKVPFYGSCDHRPGMTPTVTRRVHETPTTVPASSVS